VLTPPITVVTSDVTEMGRQAAELLFARIEGYDEPPQRVVLPTMLITRGSGEIGPRPVRPELAQGQGRRATH
jgi:LacI family transcriptional regulator